MSHVITTRRDSVAIVTLDRQDALNALSFEIIEDIGRAIDRAATANARALLFVGAGTKAFCAGADIKELRGRTMAQQEHGFETAHRIFSKLDTLPIPSIAMINGYAFGGGLELALACTFRLATPNAKMGQPEIKLGLIPGYGGTQRLPRVVGEARALDLIMTGRTIDADEAAQIGLVTAVVEGDPIEAAIAFASSFTKYSLPVLRFARDAVKRALDLPIHEGLKVEADLATLAFQTDDAAEGAAAFEEKRSPNFSDS